MQFNTTQTGRHYHLNHYRSKMPMNRADLCHIKFTYCMTYNTYIMGIYIKWNQKYICRSYFLKSNLIRCFFTCKFIQFDLPTDWQELNQTKNRQNKVICCQNDLTIWEKMIHKPLPHIGDYLHGSLFRTLFSIPLNIWMINYNLIDNVHETERHQLIFVISSYS